MNAEEKAAFNKANEKMHKLEDQWHYKHVTKHGWVSPDKEKQGFVRDYMYTKEGTDVIITCTTGFSSDHWTAHKGGVKVGFGYWGTLEEFAAKH